jgi:catechol 2,3-dioxygenase-like lactoylglutathione lyase family enzyme
MIDHVLLNVRDFEGSRTFYEAALGPLGYRVVAELEGPGCILAAEDGSMLGLRVGEASAPVHVAFSSPDRKTVDAFHANGLAAGGSDNGPPGIREHIHANYYAAFVHDPEGNNIEAVCQAAA